jgi:hypothetical protein
MGAAREYFPVLHVPFFLGFVASGLTSISGVTPLVAK